MTHETTRVILAVLIIGGFYAFMALVLMGLVAVENPEIAKLVGALFGYLAGMVTPIVSQYFRNGGSG